jgi:hypothetical protein
MDWVLKTDKTVSEMTIESRDQAWSVDFTQPAKNGPNAVGFDHYFGISASLDMVPYCFIQNDRVTVQPTEDREIEMVQGLTDKFTRKGPAAPGFTGYEVLPTFIDQAISWISGKSAEAKSGKPFFLYLPLTSPHTHFAESRLAREKWSEPIWRFRHGDGCGSGSSLEGFG